jgi:hypothetical protein
MTSPNDPVPGEDEGTTPTPGQVYLYRKLDRGIMGILIGMGAEKAGNLVGFVVLLTFIAILVIYLSRDSENTVKIILTLISIITLSLGYYFGKKNDN